MIIKKYRYHGAGRFGLHEKGKIKIGTRNFDNPRETKKGRKWFPPLKLDHFQVVRKLKTNDDQRRFVVDEEVMRKLGSKPTRLRVYFPANLTYKADGGWDIEGSGIFESSFQSYRKVKLQHDLGSVKKTGGRLRLFCFGDGETAQRLQPDGSRKIITCDPTICPLAQGDRPECSPRCKIRVILAEAESTGGVYVFETKSVQAMETFITTLRIFAHELHGHLTGVPFHLCLYKEDARDPRGQEVKVLRVYLEGPAPEELQKFKQKALAQARQVKLLTYDGPPEQALRDIAGAEGPLEDSMEDDFTVDDEFEAADDGVVVPDDEGVGDSGGETQFSATLDGEIEDDEGPGRVYSDDSEENDLAVELRENAVMLATERTVSYESALEECTRRDGRPGVRDVAAFFQFRGKDPERHKQAMKVLAWAAQNSASMVETETGKPADLPF